MSYRADEQRKTEEFERLCGGVAKAQELFSIYKNSYRRGTNYDFAMGGGASKETVFIKKALARGFTLAQCQALLDLQ